MRPALLASLIVVASACAPLPVDPDARRPALLARPGWLVVAHRGLHLRAPENSLAALRETARAGIDLAEVDVRRTKDGVLVLVHDELVDRTTEGHGRVRDHSFAELRALTLRSSDATFASERIPTLEEAVRLASELALPLYVDVKDAEPDEVARVLRDAKGTFLVYRDDREWIEELRRLAPHLPVLVEAGGRSSVPSFAERVGACGVASNVRRFEAGLGTDARARGLAVFVDVLGPVAPEERLAAARARGATAILSDDPERVRALIDRR